MGALCPRVMWARDPTCPDTNLREKAAAVHHHSASAVWKAGETEARDGVPKGTVREQGPERIPRNPLRSSEDPRLPFDWTGEEPQLSCLWVSGDFKLCTWPLLPDGRLQEGSSATQRSLRTGGNVSTFLVQRSGGRKGSLADTGKGHCPKPQRS